MNIYVYSPAEAGLVGDWPSGQLRLDGTITTNPEQADVFVVPGALHMFRNPWELDRLAFMRGKESRHVFFHCSDDETKYGKECLFIRCNTRPWNLESDPNTISWPWPVEDYLECVDLPADGFKYDVSFQGWNWSDVRKASIASCGESKLKCDIAAYPNFSGYLTSPDHPTYDLKENDRRRREFRRSMKESRVALCPESIPGVFPYRFFEAMSAARMPVLVGSDFVFPFADEIPYKDFCLTVSRHNAGVTANYISALINEMPDSFFIECGKRARYYWDNYLNGAKWAALMTYAVEKALTREVSRH